MKCIKLNKKIYQTIAISLIVMSFVLYIIMPFNACLPFSVCAKAGITGVMIIISEIIFWMGCLMLGREVALKIRRKFSIMRIINYLRVRKKGK
jgi:hypothetical protein